MTSKLAERRTSIFERISGLAREHGAVNLGQGFPDFGWPEDVVEKAAEALRTGSNQYPPMRGLPVLREAVAEHYGASGAGCGAGRGDRDLGRDRGAGGFGPGAGEARRRGPALPAALRAD